MVAAASKAVSQASGCTDCQSTAWSAAWTRGSPPHPAWVQLTGHPSWGRQSQQLGTSPGVRGGRDELFTHLHVGDLVRFKVWLGQLCWLRWGWLGIQLGFPIEVLDTLLVILAQAQRIAEDVERRHQRLGDSRVLQAQDVAELVSSHLEEVSACKGRRREMLLPT